MQTIHILHPLYFDIIRILLDISIFSSLMVIFSVNFVYSILFLIMSFIILSIIFILIGIEFIGLIFIIVYVGAIAILFLFVIMLIDLNETLTIESLSEKEISLSLILIVGISEFLLTNFYFPFDSNLILFYLGNKGFSVNNFIIYTDDTFGLSSLFYEHFSVFLIFIGLLLLCVMIGVIVILCEYLDLDKKGTISRNKILLDFKKSIMIVNNSKN